MEAVEKIQSEVEKQVNEEYGLDDSELIAKLDITKVTEYM